MPGAAALDGEDLGQDCQRDLGRRLGAQVETDRHAHPRRARPRPRRPRAADSGWPCRGGSSPGARCSPPAWPARAGAPAGRTCSRGPPAPARWTATAGRCWTSSEGMPILRSSTSGKRSARGEARPAVHHDGRKPSARASVTSGMATWLAPTTSSMEAARTPRRRPARPRRNSVRDLPAAMASRGLRAAKRRSRRHRRACPRAGRRRAASILAPLCDASRRVRTAPRARPARRGARDARRWPAWRRLASPRSTGSTKTSMVPPQVRPISHASSSPRFSSRSAGRSGPSARRPTPRSPGRRRSPRW